jgi:hypothetical protein
VELTWHPGRDQGPVTTVHVTIAPTEHATEDPALRAATVTLTHDGWDDVENGAAMRDEYQQGWTMILARYAARASG